MFVDCTNYHPARETILMRIDAPKLIILPFFIYIGWLTYEILVTLQGLKYDIWGILIMTSVVSVALMLLKICSLWCIRNHSFHHKLDSLNATLLWERMERGVQLPGYANHKYFPLISHAWNFLFPYHHWSTMAHSIIYLDNLFIATLGELWHQQKTCPESRHFSCSNFGSELIGF